MVKLEDVMKIGDKYYLLIDVQKIFDDRINSFTDEDLEE